MAVSIYLLLSISLCFCAVNGGWRSSRGNSRPTGPSSQDLKFGDMKGLLNKQVISMQRFQRPLGSSGTAAYPISHSGMLVTTRDGGKHLIHKGADFGRIEGGNTVVTDARHMSRDWKPVGNPMDVRPGTRVMDFVKAGGKDYSLFGSNCHKAASDMAKFAAPKK